MKLKLHRVTMPGLWIILTIKSQILLQPLLQPGKCQAMLLNGRIQISLAVIFVTSLLTGCVASGEYSPLLRAEPAADSVLTRAPRTLRLLYDALPDVSQSSVSLVGPAGEYRLRGMHTMGADDLMIEIFEPAATDGDYTVNWSTVVASDPAVYRGSFSFSVRTGQ